MCNLLLRNISHLQGWHFIECWVLHNTYYSVRKDQILKKATSLHPNGNSGDGQWLHPAPSGLLRTMSWGWFLWKIRALFKWTAKEDCFYEIKGEGAFDNIVDAMKKLSSPGIWMAILPALVCLAVWCTAFIVSVVCSTEQGGVVQVRMFCAHLFTKNFSTALC